MKIVKPSVTLVHMSLPMVLDEHGNLYVDDCDPGDEGHLALPPVEKIIEKAGRICYKSEGKTTFDSYKAFVDKVCNQMGHESIMEHVTVGVKVITDRGVGNEAVRHRIASYSQESTRYCNYGQDKFGNEISVIQPPGLVDDDYKDWFEGCVEIEARYLRMIARGCAPQIARGILPLCLKTEFFWTANLREWKTIMEQRTSPKAHPQMREVALMIQEILAKIAPVIFNPGATT